VSCGDERRGMGFASSPGRPLIREVHTRVPGRARFMVAMLYRSDRVKHRLEAGLSGIAGIRSVKGNVLTGNLLVVFAQEKSADEISLLILEQLGRESSSAAIEPAKQHTDLRVRPGEEQCVVGFVGPAGLFYVPLSFLGSFSVGLFQMSPILIFLMMND